MRLIMTHGYMLSGTGSNVYVQSLCRALVGEGHDLHLICQDPDPLSFDFVNEHATVDAQGVHDQGKKETPFSGRCMVYGLTSETSFPSTSTTTTRDGASRPSWT